MKQSELKSGSLFSKKFSYENIEVAKSFPSRPKIEIVKICQNAPRQVVTGAVVIFDHGCT
jgi:hypothetical protein